MTRSLIVPGRELLVIVATAILLASCNLDSIGAALGASSIENRLHAIEASIRIQKADTKETIRLLREQVTSLQATVNRFYRLQNALSTRLAKYDSTVFDPAGDKSFFRIDTDLAPFAISLREVRANADGSKVELNVGNLSAATVSGVKFKVAWGTRPPEMPTLGDVGEDDVAIKKTSEALDKWNEDYGRWGARLQRTEISILENLLPGVWNRVTLALPKIKPTDLGYLELHMSADTLVLRQN